MLIRTTVFLTAMALLIVLVDIFRMRFGKNPLKNSRKTFLKQLGKANRETLPSQESEYESVTNFAFRLPSSSNWLYVSVSNTGRNRRIHFGNSNMNPAQTS
jgi:hypothetical protein